MPTISFAALSYSVKPTGAVRTFIGYGDLSLTQEVGPSNFQYKYDAVSGSTTTTFQGTIAPNAATEQDFGGTDLPELRFEQMSWGAGKTTQVMITGTTQDSATEHMVFLGGDALPVFATTAEVRAFFNSITQISQIQVGSFGPNRVINLSDIPGSTVSQDDRIDSRFLNSPTLTMFYDGGLGNDTLIGDRSADTLVGGDGADVLVGNQGSDSLTGGSGDDRMSGGKDADRLNGGSGQDTLDGGAGDDTVFAGHDADVIIFDAGDGSDRIQTWQDNSDTLRLDDALWAELGTLTVQQVLDAFSSTTILGGRESVMLDFGGGDRLVFDGFSTALALLDDITIL